jgi:hypothetical protein
MNCRNIVVSSVNGALACPVFVTTAEFLPQHRRQLTQTRALISQAGQRGQQRLAEMNRTVEKNLIAIIGGLTGPGGCGPACSGPCTCTVSAPAGAEEDEDAS